MFGVKEPRINVERPAGLDDVKPGRNALYSRALLEARTLFPNDGVAQHRFAERSAARPLQVSASASAPLGHSDKILLDQAFFDFFVFGKGASGGRGPLSAIETFPDRIVARGADGKLYRVTYTVGMDGVTFGAPQLVENLADEQQH